MNVFGRSAMQGDDIDELVSESSLRYQRIDPAKVPLIAESLGSRRERYRLKLDCMLLRKYLVGPLVLDFPIGTGRLLSFTSNLYEIYGYDISAAYVEAAQKNYPDIADRFEVHAMESISNPRQYDSIYSLRVTGHIQDLARVVESVSAIVRPGGCWIFTIAPHHPDYARLGSLLESHGLILVAAVKYDTYSGQVGLSGAIGRIYGYWKTAVERLPIPFWLYRCVDYLFLPFAHARLVVAEKIDERP